MEQALVEGSADLDLEIGGHHELSHARLARGQVFVDWEPDDTAGGCLLRAALVRRLVLLNARVRREPAAVVLTAGPPLLRRLSDEHARLVQGVVPQPTLMLRLRFDGPDGAYAGGEERYEVPHQGRGRADVSPVILRLRVRLRAAATRPTSGRTSSAPS
jgi:hypothetical protein